MNTSAAQTAPTTAPSPDHLLDIALTAARAAADYIRSLDREGLAREYKTSSHDIVTEHDRASEEIIVAELRRLLPTCRIVGEEGGERPADTPHAGEADSAEQVVSFYVDPIDGTSNFAAGLPLFCISIGVTVGDELVAGVIDAPILGQVFTAADGPAMLNGRELRPRATNGAPDALVLSGFPGQRTWAEFPEHAARVQPQLEDGLSAIRHLGSAAIELAYVAAGWADATFLASINAWDIAAGFHILNRAGGSVRTWPGRGEKGLPDFLNPAYVACTGQERLDLVDGVFEELQALRDADL
ncbi:inositol monophosphatase family protein [Brachybacterium alimentarium]|uniref:inositol monophosphatase family protein n=1 Tax=Brachybacterium alimentarium TaxID=47845 RepID=UPI000DF1EB65|nr:inositol monophosphatase [Brachybacterium alimentarium]RCS69684.1 inositol monophosphatase [Brachybacterium alimentarium]RCS79665.1 inositol monophosphatase [Brachybacterium alimentarium]